jgi:hypothetical protein
MLLLSFRNPRPRISSFSTVELAISTPPDPATMPAGTILLPSLTKVLLMTVSRPLPSEL